MIKFDKLILITIFNIVLGVGCAYLLKQVVPIIQIPLFTSVFTIGSTLLDHKRWLD